jgi:hypothetical protein
MHFYVYIHIYVYVYYVFTDQHTYTDAVLCRDLNTVLFFKKYDKEGACISDEALTSCPNFCGDFGDSTEH